MRFHSSIAKTQFTSTLGTVILAATDHGLCGMWFDGQRHQPDMQKWREASGQPVLREAMTQLHDFFSGKRTSFELPLDLQGGTAFQQSVWRGLLAIPCGETMTYGALGQFIGHPEAVRAVGAAVGRNPISVIVPCHRVIGADGSLTGYAGGLERKAALLELEGAPIAASRPRPHAASRAAPAQRTLEEASS
jgi:methylated-DNA-[protein]-cysteine S-methyltransferase